MTIRTARKVMTFAHPFKLAGIENQLAAGTYDVATEEEQLEGVSFPAFNRLQTYLTRRVTPGSRPVPTTIVVDLDDLERAYEEQKKSTRTERVMFKRQQQRLSFPNRSRSFDPESRRVRFWAYDGAIEIAFFVEGEAVQRLAKAKLVTEDEFLRAFDSVRDALHVVADRVYTLGPKGSYTCVLSAGDI